MANTTYLKEIEEVVRQKLAEMHGCIFSAKALTLKGGGKHGFDAVSPDEKIVMGIKTCSLSNGKLKAGQVKNAISELWYLSLVDAPIRTLVLTSRPFYEAFLREMHGSLNSDLGVECIELPPEIQAKVDAVIAEASREVTPAQREEIVKEVTAEDLT